MIDIMIDLETLGVTPGCPVISIGAVTFDVNKNVLGPTFYGVLDTAKQIDAGRKVDASTLKWWMGQDGAAKMVFRENAGDPVFVLNALAKYIKQFPKAKVWGNGSTFDISILENMYAFYGIKCPWLFYNVMDLRTFKRFCADGKTIMKSGVAHNALDDACSQAQYVLDNINHVVGPDSEVRS